MPDWLIWTIGLMFIFGLFTNGFGILTLWTRRKDRWIDVTPDRLPLVLKKIQTANGFMGDDGMTEPLHCRIVPNGEKFIYELRVPGHVFKNVEYNVILTELGVKG